MSSDTRGSQVEPLPPSGVQVEIVHGAQRAWVTEVGAGLRSYDVDGRKVVDGYGVTEMASGGRGQLLVPWPNRIGDGLYRFQGSDCQLPLTEPGRHNASHGLVRWSNWVLQPSAPDRAEARQVVHPQPGYPFSLQVVVEYQLDDGGLRVRVAATNVGDRRITSVVLANPTGGNTVTVWGDRSVNYVMVFTGDGLAPDRRRRSLAIEPMTCPPDAFRTGTGLIVLEPGQTAVSTWGISSIQPIWI